MKKIIFLAFYCFLLTIAKGQSGLNDSTFNTYDNGTNPNGGFNGFVRKTVYTNTGQIIVIGDFSIYNNVPCDPVVRLNANGDLDTSFSNLTSLGLGINAYLNDVAVQPDGKIILVGNIGSPNMIRLNVDGSFDTTFMNIVALGVNSEIKRIRIQDDGKILLAGAISSFNGFPRDHVIRLLPSGALDSTFNPPNNPIYQIGPCTAMEIQPDGKIVIGENSGDLFRLMPNGNLDVSFNIGAFGVGNGTNGPITDINILSDNKILLGGTFDQYHGTTRFGLVRIQANGNLDFSFNYATSSYFRSMLVTKSNRILVGHTYTPGISQPRLLKANGVPVLLSSYNHPANNSVQFITFTPDSSFALIAGSFTNYDGSIRHGIARINVFSYINDTPCDAIEITPKSVNDTLYVQKDTIRVHNQLDPNANPFKYWYKFTATSKSHTMLFQRMAFASPLSRIKLEVYHVNTCGSVDTITPNISVDLDGNNAIPAKLGENLIIGDTYYFSFQNEYLLNYPFPIPASEDILFYGIYDMSNDHMEGAITLQQCQSYYGNSFFSNASLNSSCIPDLWYKFIALSDTADFIIQPGIPLSSASVKIYRKLNSTTYSPVTSCTGSPMGKRLHFVVDSLNVGDEYFVSIGSAIQNNSAYTRFTIQYGSKKPSVSISAISLCEVPGFGIIGTFQANSVNGGAMPLFNWHKGNGNVGSNFTDSQRTMYSLAIGDTIVCILYSSDSCYAINDTARYVVTSSTPAMKWFTDADHDGHGTLPINYSCIQPQPSNFWTLDSGDCAPNNPLMFASYPFYVDNDNDSFGTGSVMLVCAQNATLPPPGYSLIAGDCNDNNASINPGATEICDGLDNNCDGITDSVISSAFVCGMATSEGQSFTLTAPPGKVFTAVDFASYGTPDGTCGNFTLGSCHASSTMPIVEGLVIGQNSVTLTQNYQIFGDPCGGVYKRFYVQASYPQTVSLKHPFFADADGDGYGTGSPVIVCAPNASTPPSGYALNNTDCDDNNASLSPGVTEICNGIDDNCDGLTDTIRMDGMKMYLPFEGNTNDVSGNNHHATNYNASLSSGHSGVANTAYEYNGSSSRMEVASDPDLSSANFTLSLWSIMPPFLEE